MKAKELPLSGNALKLIAALSMLFDHIGLLLFPQVKLLRILGRLAFPLFAFFIAEGCRHTKHRARYLITLAMMAILFQIVYFAAIGKPYISIFGTFTISVGLIYLLEECKKSLTKENAKAWEPVLWLAAFLSLLVGGYLLNAYAHVDYGFFGIITPLCATLFHGAQGKLQVLDTLPFRLATMAIPLFGLIFIATTWIQWFCLLALPLLLLYNGKRGKYKMKYFFYIFYPAHLVLLYAIAYFL